MADLRRIYSEADEARHQAVLRRVSSAEQALAKRARQRRRAAQARALKRMMIAAAVIVAAAIAWGVVIGPIGQMGFLAAAVALVLSWVAVITVSRVPEVNVEALGQSDLPQLPERTGLWLQSQRAALPPPAVQLVDAIGLKLDTLAPQLATLDPREPAAAEVRKLLADELPDLIQGYTRVPESMRKADRDGLAPDRQLIEALGVVDSELARMSSDLASGDLQKLATQGRYLELKYRDDGTV
ncbi:hypothetical protein [uncultured Sphingomonas sp.]|uniref:hypothetical protein n=1 Tax=uncultured Sphingomonas sp. TaxID=158754 RepID=UPI0025F2555B|nr:hypothetical protein [uncultured Sphingomonas sp.]